MNEKIFGSQGTPKQINEAEKYLTGEQKQMSEERAATLEHGFKAGKEFMREKKGLSVNKAMKIFKEDGCYEIIILTPSGAKKRVDGQIENLSDIDAGSLRIDGEHYPLSAVTKIVDGESLKILWDNEEETYDGFVTKHGNNKK